MYYSSIDGHLGSFQVWVVTKSDAINILILFLVIICIHFWKLIYLEVKFLSQRAMHMFNLSRCNQTAFQSRYTNVNCHCQYVKVPVVPHSHQHFFFLVILAILVS